MLKLKPLSKDSIPNALTRAKHYRLLNEPWQAESICRDILRAEPNHQRALLYLILAITDQFGSEKGTSSVRAKELCTQLNSKYEQLYYRGIIEERLGKTSLKRDSPRVMYIAHEHFQNAMEYYEKAQKIHPENNQDAVLRWNACLRGIKEFNLKPSLNKDQVQPFLE
jgi:tetratricopeptide (TPR) repeat protein